MHYPCNKKLYENCTLIEREQFMQAKGEYEKNLEAENNKKSQAGTEDKKTK